MLYSPRQYQPTLLRVQPNLSIHMAVSGGGDKLREPRGPRKERKHDDATVVENFGKVQAIRQRKGAATGIRGSVKTQGKKWDNLTPVPPSIRVASGTAKGRKLTTPDVYLRPMMGKVKQALFSILREFDILRDDAVALDTFAGCGSVGIEALSQGMGKAVFVDYSNVACQTIAENLAHCGFGERAVVVNQRAEVFYSKPEDVLRQLGRPCFDLVTITPPYEEVDYGELLNAVVTSQTLVGDGSVVVVEYPVEMGSLPAQIGGRLTGVRNRRYGRTMLAVYAVRPDSDVDARPEEFGDLNTRFITK